MFFFLEHLLFRLGNEQTPPCLTYEYDCVLFAWNVMCFQYTNIVYVDIHTHEEVHGSNAFTQGEFKYMATLMDLITFRVSRYVMYETICFSLLNYFLLVEWKTFTLWIGCLQISVYKLLIILQSIAWCYYLLLMLPHFSLRLLLSTEVLNVLFKIRQKCSFW